MPDVHYQSVFWESLEISTKLLTITKAFNIANNKGRFLEHLISIILLFLKKFLKKISFADKCKVLITTFYTVI